MRDLIKNLTPPIFLNLLRNIYPYGWSGDYANWQEAQKNATGYDSDEIIQKVRTALLKVKNSEVAYERDSVLFDEIQYSWQLLSGLMFASTNIGGVNLLDFGGSLGSTYFQNKKFLDEIEDVSWGIVEQPHFVKVGREDFQDDRLQFFDSIEDCVKNKNPKILVLSSVLQYMEKPYDLLDQLLSYDFEYVLIDRTQFNVENRDKITLQTVPKDIYNASYPCWLFNEKQLLYSFTNRGFSLIESFSSFCDWDSSSYFFKGFIFKRR